ncbi:adenylate kinase [Actinacidiphila oryziradicis]|uniref:Adenylate kinase n=1 Tax=Actinacidiphila oryziradicis TaxID=2571141 RepID=A0A4U0S9X3_9ACTN|nr:adenylate kinase [Actinacidiphila oryziradicis]TKA05017.1 adenylate kinase [Actinacidiphila oryziradicis]
MRIVLVGPPGAGKGTQAEIISAQLAVPHISTGDIFRANLRQGTELGKSAQSYMDAGDLVPDEVVIAMVRDRLAEPDATTGFLLDGFPRSRPQAEALDGLLTDLGTSLDTVLELQVDTEEVVRRLAMRSAESGRADDTAETVRHRQEVYAQQTAPLVTHYAEQGLLNAVDAVGEVDEVTGRIMQALGAEGTGRTSAALA